MAQLKGSEYLNPLPLDSDRSYVGAVERIEVNISIDKAEQLTGGVWVVASSTCL
jgi:hypothetical protein